jgi:hypothetical protein
MRNQIATNSRVQYIVYRIKLLIETLKKQETVSDLKDTGRRLSHLSSRLKELLPSNIKTLQKQMYIWNDFYMLIGQDLALLKKESPTEDEMKKIVCARKVIAPVQISTALLGGNLCPVFKQCV